MGNSATYSDIVDCETILLPMGQSTDGLYRSLAQSRARGSSFTAAAAYFTGFTHGVTLSRNYISAAAAAHCSRHSSLFTQLNSIHGHALAIGITL
jgi:hypothetical protein